MDTENERLRKRLYDKSKKHTKKLASGYARHMTGEECLDALAKEEWASAMKNVFKEPILTARRDAYEKHCKQMSADEKAREKELEKARKDLERRQKEIERFRIQEEKRRQKAREKESKDAPALEKVVAAAAAKATKAVLAETRRCTAQAKKRVTDVDGEDAVGEGSVVVEKSRRRPQPRHAQHMAIAMDEMGTRRFNASRLVIGCHSPGSYQGHSAPHEIPKPRLFPR